MQSDETLASLGTREAFEELYGRHKGSLYAFLLRQVRDPALADDLFQTTILKAFRNLATFRGASSFKTWLFTIASRSVIDDRRRSKPVLVLTDVAAAPRESHREEIEILTRALDELPPQHKALFLLVRYHEMKVADAAEAAGLSPASGKVTLFRIQKKLGELLGKVRT